nr:MAG TPA: hypothetical protein [Caudoviricetes sp.]
MKVLIDIPKEFEVDYHTDRFRDFFERAVADMDVMCGTYERETADVLAKAFEESGVYDPDKVVEQLEDYLFHKYCIEGDSEIEKIVKGGGVDGN